DSVPPLTNPRTRRRLLCASVDASSGCDSCRPGGCRVLRGGRVTSTFGLVSCRPTSRRTGSCRGAVHSFSKSPRTSTDVVQLGTVCRVAGGRSTAGLVRQQKRDGVFGGDRR